MGTLTWLAGGAVALLVARRLRIGLCRSLLVESAAALLAALACGLTATVLDFGGWGEPDWRAALFALIGSFGVVGALRIGRQSPTR